ncbi:hypothetical protein ELI_4446 [Eubacterium callanderi]|uniref:Uncharacterized protein n=1 Tax=Eubacterium callanderi TaxID=53442 RepID=E3GQT8_9FIRM|nr:hypothetical protein ELI_4446 [Eubacterium callanderi]
MKFLKAAPGFSFVTALKRKYFYAIMNHKLCEGKRNGRR